MIPFNKPSVVGAELAHIEAALQAGHLSGDGEFTKKCQAFFGQRYGFSKCLLTTSCTDALEMAALLLRIQPGDEVIAPSYTFVSTVNAFVLRGAKIVFADSLPDHPNIDSEALEELITPRTRAIVVVHYAGVACDMQKILEISARHRIPVVEDAAQCVEAYWQERPLGSLGEFSTFSFHETKNVSSGEGGMLVVSQPEYFLRAEIIREKGTNRSQFFRGEVNKYEWVDIGSSFLPSELNAAYLWGQLEQLERIQEKRLSIWNTYFQELIGLQQAGVLKAPLIPVYARHNGHIFYLICASAQERADLLAFLKRKEILAVFHYQALHRSQFYRDQHDGRILKNSELFSDRLVRLPLYHSLTESEQERIVEAVWDFYQRPR